MRAKLVVVGGKANKSQVSLKVPGTIGRSREADLTVAHPMVSRRHCEIVESGGVLKIRDLGSLNGTFVRKKQIREAELRPNDEFTVGPLTFRVEYDPRLAAAPPNASPEDVPGSGEQASPPPGAAAVPCPVGVAPPGGPLPDLDSWNDAAADSSASSQQASGNTSSPSETGPLPLPSGDTSEDADFDLAVANQRAAADPLLSDLDLFEVDSGAETEPAAAESAEPDDRVSGADESTGDEDLDAFFKQLE